MAGLGSTRYEAYNLINDELVGITSAGGYWFDPTVSTDPPSPDEVLANPVLVVSFGSEIFTDVTRGHFYTSIFTIYVDGYFTKASTYLHDGCKLSQDVRRAVLAEVDSIADDISPVTSIRLGDMDQETGWLDVDGGQVRFRQPFEIHYKTRTDW